MIDTSIKIRIFNIQKYNLYDGPGIRTIVFFQGCPLHCKWCANPESSSNKYRIMFNSSLCKNCGNCVVSCPINIHTINKETQKHEINTNIDCNGCKKCLETCYCSALSIVGKDMTVSEILEVINEDRIFYEQSGGGVTLSGGEVLSQSSSACILLKACKQSMINTAIETSGYGKREDILNIAKYTDLFLYDIKHTDNSIHKNLTGVDNKIILSNLHELLINHYNVKIRMPILKNINDSISEIENVIRLLIPYKNYSNFKGIDLLPYHKLGVNKYSQLGIKYSIKNDPSMDSNSLNKIKEKLSRYFKNVSIIKH